MKNIKLIKIFGIQIEIHFSWFLVFALVGWTLAVSYFPLVYPFFKTYTYWSMGIISAVLLFLSVVFHELAHSFIAVKNGLPIKKITLFVFGGVASMSSEVPNAKTEFKMAFAGPLCSIVLMGIFGVMAVFLKNNLYLKPLYGVTKYLAVINGVLAGFNLIPGFPLDGGRVLRSIIWYFTGNFKKATLIAVIIGKGFAVIFVSLGLANIFLMDSFIGGLWIMFIGFFLYHLADAGYRQISFNNVFGALTVGNIIKRNITVVSVDTDIDDLVNNYFLNFRYSAFPVVSSDNKLAGMVTLNNVKTISKEKRPYVTVLSIMDKNMDKFTVHSKENISSAVNKIIKNKTGRVICVENGYPVGILTKKDIMTILKLKTYLG